MNKQKAIELLQELPSIHKENTRFSNINTSKDVWWVEIPAVKFEKDLNILLHTGKAILWLFVKGNTFKNFSNFFSTRTDNEAISIELGCAKNSNYLIDIRPGGTKINFNPFLIATINLNNTILSLLDANLLPLELNPLAPTDKKNHFFVSKNLLGKGEIIEVSFKSGVRRGEIYVYDHDALCKNCMHELNSRNTWKNTGNWSSSANIPGWAIAYVTQLK